MNSRCSAATWSLIDVSVLSQPLTCPYVFNTSWSTPPTMMLKTMQRRSHWHVLPENILWAFITAADLRSRTQMVAFLYGVSPIDNKQVKEIKVCYPLWTFPADADRMLFQTIAWVPQRGSNNSVELPAQLPNDDFLQVLKDLEPLGWIKTQALEIAHLSPTDVTLQHRPTSSICPRTENRPWQTFWTIWKSKRLILQR
jgi:hypothetical protein